MTDLLKQCRRCGTEKPMDDFPVTTTKSRNGLRAWTYSRQDCHACIKTKRAADFQRNKEAWRPARDRWVRDNWEKSRWSASSSRARAKGATEFLSFEEWLAFRSAPACHWCGCELHRSFTNIDHIRPLAWGGQHTADNLVMACANCNMRREWERKTKYRKESE